jgi:hypothetical protein
MTSARQPAIPTILRLTSHVGADVVAHAVHVRVADGVLVELGAVLKHRVQAPVPALGARLDLGGADVHADGAGDLEELLDRLLGGVGLGVGRARLELPENDAGVRGGGLRVSLDDLWALAESRGRPAMGSNGRHDNMGVNATSHKHACPPASRSVAWQYAQRPLAATACSSLPQSAVDTHCP